MNIYEVIVVVCILGVAVGVPVWLRVLYKNDTPAED